ncbi:sulfotransferase domain-containing protein [Ruegeria sp. HKCCA5426]|uniref:sulfotransferase domain-containing protein n=1 Tax=Ruegeria sp. HKCCA5426 TaxID=2682985 RepID=UPI001487747D|nr:sulfotransferase domain-containing protein [Ruegeria sp. HKCCA5426]
MKPRFLCVGTHHKTGTIWMRKVFREIHQDQSIPFMQCYRAKRLADAAETGPQIIVNWSSKFPRELLELGHARFLHVIRDPRDVLLSGTRYHQIAPTGNEKFLREARAEWDGKTYKEYISSLPNELDKLMFEMENKHHQTLTEMMAWPYGHENAIDVKYEDLIEDSTCDLFRKILRNFDIEGLDIDKAVRSYWKHSLFGGLKKKTDRAERISLHIGSGAKAQWQSKLPREVAEVYEARYGGALRKLGYESNSDWVKTCPPSSQIFA